MSFTKALKKKVTKEPGSKPSQSNIDISKLISGEPFLDENSVLELDTAQVVNKEQVRTQFDEAYIASLGVSMVEVGQIQPIVVSPVNKEGKYEIQKGECRWRAAKLKGLKIKAIVDPRKLNETEIILGELVENIQRDNLKPLEIAVAIKGLKDGGMKQGEIAKKMGKNDAFISRHIKLLSMPECVHRLYQDGDVSDVQTLNNLTKLHKMNPDRVKGICQSVPQTGLSRRQSDSFLKEEGSISKAVGKDDKSKPAEPEHSQSSSDNSLKDNFAHVQNSSELEDNPGEEVGHLAVDEPLSREPTDKNPVTDPAIPESTFSPSSTSISEQTSSGMDDDDGLLFRDGQPGMFSIEVKIKNGPAGVICLDRKDTDAEHIWVKVDSEKVRVHIDQISIIGTVG